VVASHPPVHAVEMAPTVGVRQKQRNVAEVKAALRAEDATDLKFRRQPYDPIQE